MKNARGCQEGWLRKGRGAIDVLCPPVSFGARIRNLRLGKGVQQKDLAEMLGIYKVSLCRYEKDSVRPDEKLIKMIARL